MDVKLLAGLDSEARREVLRIAHRRRFKKHEFVFHEGDVGDSVHLLVTGRVAVRVTTTFGSIVTFDVMSTGDSFGEQALLNEAGRRTATIQALEPVETMVLFRDAFAALRRAHPQVERVLVEMLAAQVRRLSTQLLEALYVPVETRVLRRLVELANAYSDADTSCVTIPLTQDDLATMAGTTRPTANRVLQRASEHGAVALGRSRVDITDLATLKRLAT